MVGCYEFTGEEVRPLTKAEPLPESPSTPQTVPPAGCQRRCGYLLPGESRVPRPGILTLSPLWIPFEFSARLPGVLLSFAPTPEGRRMFSRHLSHFSDLCFSEPGLRADISSAASKAGPKFSGSVPRPLVFGSDSAGRKRRRPYCRGVASSLASVRFHGVPFWSS